MTNRIGIVGQLSGEIWGIHEDYLAFVEHFGNPVVIYPTEVVDFHRTYWLDALVLPGGADVATNRYAWFPSIFAGHPNPFLEYFDTQILPSLIGTMPIFGICRGLQTLNVVLGGTLYQHLWTHPYSKSKQDAVHEIKIMGGEKIGWGMLVNSFHHQAIKKLGECLKIEAESTDGIVEAISDWKRDIFAVQWHPERLLDDYSIQAFEKILH